MVNSIPPRHDDPLPYCTVALWQLLIGEELMGDLTACNFAHVNQSSVLIYLTACNFAHVKQSSEICI